MGFWYMKLDTSISNIQVEIQVDHIREGDQRREEAEEEALLPGGFRKVL